MNLSASGAASLTTFSSAQRVWSKPAALQRGVGMAWLAKSSRPSRRAEDVTADQRRATVTCVHVAAQLQVSHHHQLVNPAGYPIHT
jgi:hypothetical protein